MSDDDPSPVHLRLLEALRDPGAGSREEQALLLNVTKLRDLRVLDVMVPRADIVAVDINAPLEQALEAFGDGAHSRLPVYRETLDDPIGVVHLKDLALKHGFGAASERFALSDHVRSVLFAPPSMRILSLMQRMQATRRHMALVIDEYGGVDGLVTIEDLIEQIVGDIEDEHDDENGPLWRRETSGAWLVEARAEIPDFEKATGARVTLEDWEEDVDTLGGLVFMLCGRVPSRGEVIQHPAGHEFDVVDADPRRIKRLRVRIGAPETDGPPAAGGAPAGAELDAPQTDAHAADAEEAAAEEAAAEAGTRATTPPGPGHGAA